MDMKLIDFLKLHWKPMKQDQADGFTYGLGVRVYLISEYNFSDFIPLEYISGVLKKRPELKQFKAITNRFALNNQAKKIFNRDFKFEHIVPKKFIIRYFCGSKTPEEFEKIIRENLSHAFISVEEERRLPRIAGRDTLKKALRVYKDQNIHLTPFHFDHERGTR
jgi:hypothetical protein